MAKKKTALPKMPKTVKIDPDSPPSAQLHAMADNLAGLEKLAARKDAPQPFKELVAIMGTTFLAAMGGQANFMQMAMTEARKANEAKK